MEKLPKLQPSNRNREFLERSDVERARIIESWLMSGELSHRAMDDLLLGFDSRDTRGWKSMGVLSYLGLKKEFKGLFSDIGYESTIKILKADSQNFDLVISHLDLLKNSYDSALSTLSGLSAEKTKKPSNSMSGDLTKLKSTDGILAGEKVYRREQSLLRELLIEGKSELQCSLCHRQIPSDLIVAAHIKPRYICSHEERTTPDIVMPLCKLGCDDLYEKSYLIVDHVGLVQRGRNTVATADVSDALVFLIGKRCLSFNEVTKPFFAERARLLTYWN